MNKKWVPMVLIGVLAVAVILLKTFKKTNPVRPKTDVTNTDNRRDPAAVVDRNRGFDRRVSFLEYSNHARCRMECRHITQAEVEDIMRNGKINYNKSDLQNARCPRYALEGITADDQRVRIVFAQCDFKTEVVTVIDLEKEWQCACPGDDKKFENRN